jgi:hypothetical protein
MGSPVESPHDLHGAGDGIFGRYLDFGASGTLAWMCWRSGIRASGISGSGPRIDAASIQLIGEFPLLPASR